MRFFAMPEGSVWSLYADLLTIPEDTEEPRKPTRFRLSSQAAAAMKSFNGRMQNLPGEDEDDEAAEDEEDEPFEPSDGEFDGLPDL